jgi:predicted nucleotidyltransferase
MDPIEIIRGVIGGLIPYPQRTILFGSRAMRTNREDSDYDILIVADVPGDRKKELVILQRKLRRLLAQKGLDVDVILRDKGYVDEMKVFYGNIISEALAYGVLI